MQQFAKILIIMGMVSIMVGAVLLVFGKIPGIGKLPGDIVIKRENYSFYFPLTTCLLISAFLTLIFYLFQQK